MGCFFCSATDDFSHDDDCPQREKIEVADHVHHIPTGEDWVVKSVDETHVEPAGWPPCRAKLSDCRLIKKATPEQREEMRRMAK